MNQLLTDEVLDTLANNLSDRIVQRIDELRLHKKWLSMKEAMDYTGKSRNTIKKWLEEGYIDGKKTTGNWQINRESIEDWFQSDII